GQPLMHQNRTLIGIDAAPVRAAVALALGKFKRLSSQALQIVARLQAKNAEDGTHVGKLLVDGRWGVIPTSRASVTRAENKKPAFAMRVFLVTRLVIYA
ncbi:MAG TPA: hypothetical protein VLF15_12855, partial [Pseudoxanthomonas sp.]|nr:hypothetical protein [Pseudoxanthomonas sp.]